ncbi:MAG: U32 family peptidase [Eubacteriales bacterium]|nr:U32 family peptidase [Eubacteriales bacterium]
MRASLPELLAPAGSMEAVRAAVQNGADAVYLGFGTFNARRGAKNFSAEEMREALLYCRLRGVKTNVTVNTLASDRELPALLDDVRLLLEAGADALIVQDLGAARRIHQAFPEAVLHASTQMTIHSLEGARAAKELGFSRVVLARELPLDAIRHITEHAGVETEVFVHGALCMCYSGQCGLSAVIGRRSGNRGLCAQPCRLPYGGKNNYPMSLKDLCLLPRLRALCEAGVSSLKIEGRMKRPEYVAIVTRIYAAVLREGRAPTQEEMDTLAKVFSRDGFTQGYLDDQPGPSMFGTRPAAPESGLKPLYDVAARSFAEGQECGHVPVQLHFTAHDGAPMQLQADDGTHTVCITAGVPERAQKRETTAADVEGSLRRMGGTVFNAERVTVELDSGLRIAAKQLNDLRRQTLGALTQARTTVPPVREHTQTAEMLAKHTPFSGYTVQVRTLAQITDEMAALPIQAFYVPAAQLAGHPVRAAQLASLGCTLVPVLPRIVWDREQTEVLRQLEACKTLGCTAALCGNIAQVALVQRMGLTAYGDFGLNVFNAAALDALYDMGVQRQTLSFELRLPQIRDMRKPLETELIVCGRLPLMLTENCMIAGAKGGCKRDGKGVCAKGAYYLTDRRGARFPVFREEHCRNSLYNSQPLYLERNEYQQTGITYARLLFTDETPRTALHIAQAVLDGRQPDFGAPATRGLYRRGVE